TGEQQRVAFGIGFAELGAREAVRAREVLKDDAVTEPAREFVGDEAGDRVPHACASLRGDDCLYAAPFVWPLRSRGGSHSGSQKQEQCECSGRKSPHNDARTCRDSGNVSCLLIGFRLVGGGMESLMDPRSAPLVVAVVAALAFAVLLLASLLARSRRRAGRLLDEKHVLEIELARTRAAQQERERAFETMKAELFDARERLKADFQLLAAQVLQEREAHFDA